jgi:hypothetical protein
MRNQQRVACTKKRFESQRTAKRAARLIRDRGERMHAYFCTACSAWHVGH